MTEFWRFLLKRVLFLPVGLFVVVSLAFWIVAVIPSDPARVVAGPVATDQQVAAVRRQLGLDHTLIYRYWEYLRGIVLHGDLGHSFYSGRAVTADLWQYFPSTLELITAATVVAAILGISVGTMAAMSQGFPDRIGRFYISVTQSIPDFVLGIVFIYVFFYVLGWAPAPTGQLGILDPTPPHITNSIVLDTMITGHWSLLSSALAHAVLPVCALGIFYSSVFAKTTRSALARALHSHQVEFARACGLPERTVLAYAFRVARTPIITYGAILFAALAGASAIVEVVFSWGGFGQFAVDRILNLDVPEIQGVILVFGTMTMLVFLLLDILIVGLDPRVSYE